MKIREYVMVKNELDHPSLEEVGCYEWEGTLTHTNEIHRMFNEVFRMNRLSTEMSYVVAFDHAKKPKGVCRIGHGDTSESLMAMQSIFSFLLLVGANSFCIAHNHISNLPDASESDKSITWRTKFLSEFFNNLEFLGHMIINPRGYIIDGGILNGTRYIK